MVVFADTMYTFRNTQGRGVKIDNFFSLLTFFTANIACTDPEGWGGQGSRTPLEKHKLYGIQKGISNWTPLEKVGPPLEKMFEPLWNLGIL